MSITQTLQSVPLGRVKGRRKKEFSYCRGNEVLNRVHHWIHSNFPWSKEKIQYVNVYDGGNKKEEKAKGITHLVKIYMKTEASLSRKSQENILLLTG